MKEKELDKSAFREYDVRGEYPTQIDENTAYKIGLAFGTTIKRNGKSKCVVGHDNRLSSDSLTDALLKGITSTGIDVTYLGLVTTPMYYYACIYLGIDSGVMVTASHNPTNDNGFKIALSNYDNACGDAIIDLYNLACSGEFESGEGKIENFDIRDAYLDRITEYIKIEKPLNVVLDPANATGSIIIKDIFDRIENVNAIYINEVSDGHFPNHHPDPLVPENMKQISEKVREVRADVGIALDGDADRVGFVDENGVIIPIDTYMAIVWDDIMDKVDNKTALFDVKCSKQLEDEIIKLGGTPYIYRTGNSYQKNKIKEMDLAFGGELSGHVFFRDKWDGFDDGIYAGLRLLEILSRTDKKLSELDDNFNKYYSTPEIKIATTEEKKFNIVEKVKDYTNEKGYKIITIDGVRVQFADGWALVRASNTGPNLTTRFEANSESRLEEIKTEFMTLIEEYNK